MSRFNFIKYDEKSAKLSEKYKKRFEELEAEITADLGPGKRSFATTMTKLEECFMWLGKSIRDAQIERGGSNETVKFGTKE